MRKREAVGVPALVDAIAQVDYAKVFVHPAMTGSPADPAAILLDEAKKIVTGARRAAYGNPEDNFATIADLWQTYLRRRYQDAGATPGSTVPDVSASDVAAMMVLMKVARLAETPGHHDSLVDIAGYAGCAVRCAPKVQR